MSWDDASSYIHEYGHPELQRQVMTILEHRRERLIVEHMVWYTLPWYRRLVRTLLGMAPEAL